ncbi:MAG TPA: methyltransferase domain-containing protein [Terriglobales bacterium]|nr:methyltransferase domain-containing protein [Terriglobales bacterium]
MNSATEKVRRNAICAACGSFERHRMVWMVLQTLAKERDFRSMRVLHFAPEPCFQKRFRTMFGKYETADISGRHVDHKADMCQLPFSEGSFDMVIASHVLHHVLDEETALKNLRRVLRPGGVAILPVPVFSDTTVEYPYPIETQRRAPGMDYLERCRKVFDKVRVFSSGDFDPKYQIWIYEDRSHWPPLLQLRPRSVGEKHKEYVPVCIA